MKLGTIIRAIVRPIVNVITFDDAIKIKVFGDYGYGLLVADHDPMHGYGCPTRARRRAIGGLTLAYWGPDTLVHQDPSAEKGAAS